MSAVTYEVTLQVDADIAADYLAWLHAHAQEMRALPGFLAARVSAVREPAADAGRVAFCCHYRLRDAAALDDYLRLHAPRLRAEGVARFGGRFAATRRVLEDLGDY